MKIEPFIQEWFLQPNRVDDLLGIRRGIERECLRVSKAGRIAQTPHPKALGATLCHPSITTDFSEALLEFITKPHTTIEDCLTELESLHIFTQHNLNNEEYLWPYSMPPYIQDADEIPIADYGNSPVGRMKQVYRRGLDVRYGKHMQTIAGIHYNISFPNTFFASLQKLMLDQADQATSANHNLREFKDLMYFKLVRNFLKNGWFLVLTQGKSNQCDPSFIRQAQLQEATAESLGLETINHQMPAPVVNLNNEIVQKNESLVANNGTSLRMGTIGYHNTAQAGLFICYDQLKSYVHTINNALNTPNQTYDEIGLWNDRNQRQQITTNVIQFENEFYGSIRPKQTTQLLERPSLALERRGVEYIEVRNLDINAKEDIGISEHTAATTEIFVIACLLAESPFLSIEDYDAISTKNEQVSLQGNNPQEPFLNEAIQMWQPLQWIARQLDKAYKTSLYSEAWQDTLDQLKDISSQAPVSRNTAAQKRPSFWDQGKILGRAHQIYSLQQNLSSKVQSELEAASEASLNDLSKMNDCTNEELQTHIDRYFKGMPALSSEVICQAIQPGNS